MGKQKLRGLTHTMGIDVDDDGRIRWFIAQLHNGEIHEIEFSKDRFDSVTKARISGFAEMDRRQHSARQRTTPSVNAMHAAG